MRLWKESSTRAKIAIAVSMSVLCPVVATQLHAILASRHTANQDLSDLSRAVDDTIKTLDGLETLGAPDKGGLLSPALPPSMMFTAYKHMPSNSGLAVGGLTRAQPAPGASLQDVATYSPQPLVVPTSSSTSSGMGGLSVVHGVGSVWTPTIVTSSARHGLTAAHGVNHALHGTIVSTGSTDPAGFGSSDHSTSADSQPFFLDQPANAIAVADTPEPGTVTVLGLGFLGLALYARKSRRRYL